MNDILYIVMPAYNEEETISDVVLSWLPILKGKNELSRLVVSDVGSTDRTHEILLEIQKEFPQLIVLDSGMEKQHGPKLIGMYRYAIVNGAEWIFQTDSDGQTNPGEFATFWDIREKYNGILATRPVRGDGWIRAFVEKVVCMLLKLYFGVKVPDANAPFRLMKAGLIAKYIDRLPTNYHIPNIMFTTWFSYYKENITFLEISFQPRQGGKNSVNMKKIFSTGLQAVKEFRAFKKQL